MCVNEIIRLVQIKQNKINCRSKHCDESAQVEKILQVSHIIKNISYFTWSIRIHLLECALDNMISA